MQIDSDILVIGGGINGVGIADAASSNGLKVTLCEMNDLAQATSSNSSKLIHGGIRYLENFELKMVRESLIERDVLLNAAPHLVTPVNFIIPNNNVRSSLLIKAGLFLYNHLYFQKKLPKARTVRSVELLDFNLKDEFTKSGFSYYDCRVDDARLVLHVAKKAKQQGARILPRHYVENAIVKDNIWQVTVIDKHSNQKITISTKSIINAAGPWVNDVVHNACGLLPKQTTKLVKGSHIYVPKLYDGDEALVLQNKDERIVFIIPYKDEYSLIGTTDIPVTNMESENYVSDDEKKYLLSLCNEFFNKELTADDIIGEYWGYRPLFGSKEKSASKISRDYCFELQTIQRAPILTVYGGKLTSYRKLSQKAVFKLKQYFPSIEKTKEQYILPGGNLKKQNFDEFLKEIQDAYPLIDKILIKHYAKNFGTEAYIVLKNIKNIEDLGIHFGNNLYEQEVKYLIKEEWAKTTDDILKRRGHFIYEFNNQQKANINEWLLTKT